MQLENIEPEKKKFNAKSILLIFGLIVMIILGVSIKSAVDLKRNFPEETSKPIIVPKNIGSNESDLDQNKCYQSIPYNVTLNRTIIENVSDYFCDPKHYNITFSVNSRRWVDDYWNNTIVGQHYEEDIYFYNKEPYTLCINASVIFKRNSMFGFIETLNLDPQEIIIAIRKNSFYRLNYKWNTSKDSTKFYEIELNNLLSEEECKKIFEEEEILSRRNELNITNTNYIDGLDIKGCFKYTTVEVEKIEEYNETRYEQKEVPC